MIGNALKRQRIREAEERAEKRFLRAWAEAEETGEPVEVVLARLKAEEKGKKRASLLRRWWQGLRQRTKGNKREVR